MSNPAKRLNSRHRVNTQKPIRFSFDGRSYTGYEGDTLASALLANGVKRVGRSFKLHRPRGLMGVGREEPNALVQLENGAFGEPNARATLIPLYEGLQARGQNAWPNVDRDIFSSLGLFHRLFPASFYYKSMMWPNWSWYEGIVRRLAGLGKAPAESDVQQYHKRNMHCEIFICGGGPAGLASALAAGRSGLRVVLVDEQEELGGSLLGENRLINGAPATDWVANIVAQLKAMPEVTLLPRTSVIGYYENNFLAAIERVTNHLGPEADLNQPRERLWRIHAKKVVLATGAIERPMVFSNNDRPGVMLASAVQTYLNRYGVAAGKNALVVTNNDSAYRTAIDLHNMGVCVAGIVDTRKHANGPFQQAASELGITVYRGYAIKQLHGRRSIKSVTVSPHLGEGRLGGGKKEIKCDLVAMSGGWTPTIHLYSQAGGALQFNDESQCFTPLECAQDVAVVGAANGGFSLSESLAQGYVSGTEAALALGTGNLEAIEPEQCREWQEQRPEAYWYTKGSSTEKQWLDFQYDVKVSDIELAQRENFVSIEHVKRYTTSGMSVDQGKTGNINTLAVMAEISGRTIPQVGTTKFRPPYHPATLGTLAGRSIGSQYTPILQMPAHSWHLEHGGRMEDYGGYQRPDFYPQPGEDEAATIRREVSAVRNGVGMFDGTPLGKIEVKGPDAATFLNRVYINNAASLKVGFARYGFMLNENGVVIDDGVFVRMADDHFLLHTTSAGAGRIAQWLEEWLLCEWPHLKVVVSNVTTQWANVTVSGPKARDVMSQLESDIDFGVDAFPHMQYRAGTIGGVCIRILRASFTGEVSYEINVPARYGHSLWEAVYEAGQEFGITPYGVESLLRLRIEKGYVAVGLDTDGNTNPLDLGWGGAIARKSDDFIGRRSLARPNDQRSERLQFIGLHSLDKNETLSIGGHIVSSATPKMPEASQGYVTSACFSPTLNMSIGLGLVSGGMSRIGEIIHVYANGKTQAAKLVPPAHFDPAGEKLNG